jgi:hypothetical protein
VCTVRKVNYNFTKTNHLFLCCTFLVGFASNAPLQDFSAKTTTTVICFRKTSYVMGGRYSHYF